LLHLDKGIFLKILWDVGRNELGSIFLHNPGL
jgi:hypothetical protein